MKLLIFTIFFFFSGLDDTVIFSCMPRLSLFSNYPPYVISLIYGCYPGMMIMISLISGNFIDKYFPVDIMIITLIFKSISAFFFGCIEFIQINSLSLAVIFLTRLTLAATSALGTTTILSKLALENNLETISKKFGILELAFGLGAVLGPVLGAALHKAGGFLAPLYLISFSYAILALVLVIDYDYKDMDKFTSTSNNDFSLRTTLIKSKSWWLLSISITFGLLAVGCLAQSFFQFLFLELDLSETASSFCYVCGPVSYSIACPLIGTVNRAQFADGYWLLKFGILLSGIGFLFIGPIPVFQMSSTMNIICSVFGNFVFGIGLAFILVPGFTQQMDLARHMGLQQNSQLYCQLSGIFNTLQSIGLTIGPILGELISIIIGFRWMSTIIGMLFILLLVAFFQLTNNNIHSYSIIGSETFKENKYDNDQ